MLTQDKSAEMLFWAATLLGRRKFLLHLVSWPKRQEEWVRVLGCVCARACWVCVCTCMLGVCVHMHMCARACWGVRVCTCVLGVYVHVHTGGGCACACMLGCLTFLFKVINDTLSSPSLLHFYSSGRVILSCLADSEAMLIFQFYFLPNIMTAQEGKFLVK
jgi:hypothetical protein